MAKTTPNAKTEPGRFLEEVMHRRQPIRMDDFARLDWGPDWDEEVAALEAMIAERRERERRAGATVLRTR